LEPDPLRGLEEVLEALGLLDRAELLDVEEGADSDLSGDLAPKICGLPLNLKLSIWKVELIL